MRQAVEMNLTPSPISVRAWQAWLWLVQGDLSAAAQWANEIEPTIKGDLNPALEFDHMILARIQMVQNRLDDAQLLLERLFTADSNGRRFGRVIVICILQALNAWLRDDITKAVDRLGYGLSIAEPEGYVRTFVDEGAPMLALLRGAQKRGIASSYVSTLLAAFDEDTPRAITSQTQNWIGQSSEPLSERERDVLRLVIDGVSNREIAEQLFVSLGTMKKHISNIFIKLDAHSRTQAIAIVRQNNLI
jgi:LuxR family transcriptional regulator, maltose regulon positive regulatory protein